MKCDAYFLQNIVQHYPWGEETAIPELLGIKADGRPFAELWMGDHPRGPSKVLSKEGKFEELGDLLSTNPEAFLGSGINGKYGGRLPFLFKVLAAKTPLSIQAHPNKAQAEAGFAREEAAGIPIDAPHRNYRDRNHKPEIIAALTPFTAMCGFRDREEIIDGFSRLKSRTAEGKLLPLLKEKEHALSSFFTALLNLEKEDTKELADALASWAREERGALDGKKKEAALVRRFINYYPDDPAVSAPLYLNVIRLDPGQALYQPAGLLHAYVEGVGVELMANSDNVLRGGLTHKHIDMNELESVLIFSSSTPAILTPVKTDAGLFRYQTPAQEFELQRFDGGEATIEGRFPAIVLVTKGHLMFRVSGQADSMEAKRGQSLFLPATCGLQISGEGQAYIATLPGDLLGEIIS
jgi:mannose-6-phosphate isomerase